jgi:branched-subunit amino acid transport protein
MISTQRSETRPMLRQFWICTAMTLASACVSAGFSVAGLLGSSAADAFAQYAASRTVALLLTVLVAIGFRSALGMVLLGIAMTAVQFFDGVIGVLAHDPFKTYGPFVFALLNALAVWRLLRSRQAARVADL